MAPPVSEHRPLDPKGAALALLLAALWGANPVAIKLGLADMPPFRLALARFGLSAVVIFGYAMLMRQYDVLVIRRGEGRAIASLGWLFVVQVALMNYGLERTTAAHGVVVLNSYAVHTVVFAHFLIPGDRLTPRKLAGVLIAYSGVVILFARSFSLSSSTLVGDLIVAVSALILGDRVVYIARAVQHLDPVRLMLYQSLVGCGGFLLLSLLTESARPTHWTLALALSILFQGALVGGFNFLLNAMLLQIYRPSGLATMALTTPIWGVLVAAAVNREGLSPELALSTLLVVAGIALTARR